MTVALHLSFPAGRYHGTAWGHHVNEGEIDWPPSPFRILRALVAQAYRDPRGVDRGLLERLLKKLAARPPAFDVPFTSRGHARYYQSLNDPDLDKKVRVVDAFVGIPPDETLVVQWEGVELEDDERRLLTRLTGSLTYLGRAESWCDARLGEPSARAVGPGEGEGEVVSLLALRHDAESPVDVLEQTTETMRKQGAIVPQGTKRVRYFVAERAPVEPASAHLDADAAIVLLSGTVKPLAIDTVRIADLYRRALLRKLGDDAPSVITGRANGERLATGHKHAHYLPFDPDQDGRLEYILVTAEAGFDHVVLEAMRRLRYLRLRDGTVHDVRLLEVGSLAGFRDRWPEWPMGVARQWISSTPFLLNRHPKRRGGGWVDTPEEQLRRELAFRELEPASIERVELRHLRGGRDLRWLEFRRWRAKQSPAIAQAFGFRLTFERAIEGPITAGFGAHFGLGMFEPVGPAAEGEG